MNQLLTLSSINETDLQKVGQRAIDLSAAYKTKANIPLSFIIPNSVFYEFLLQNKLMLEIRKILNTLDKTDESIEKAYIQIKSLFEVSSIPEEFKEELFEAYEALSETKTHNAQAFLEGNEPVVNLIISPNYSLESEKLLGFLFNIQGFDNFLNGLKSCWLSVYSPEHLKFRENKGIDEFTTGIIVQAFVQAECTIDAYSKSIIGDYDIPINAYFGLPDITYKIEKDHYSVSKEHFGIVLQEVKNQSHILLRNIKSGTLLKRSLGSKGLIQKIDNKQILEVARNIERLSIMTKLHFRILMFISESKNIIFSIDRISERNSESEQAHIKEEKERTELIEPTALKIVSKEVNYEDIAVTPDKKGEETLAELINSHIQIDEENKQPAPESVSKQAFAWETAINSKKNPEPKETENIKEIILEEKTAETQDYSEQQETSEPLPELNEKIIILEDNDEFILSPKKEKNEDPDIQIAKNKEEMESEETNTENAAQQTAPDNEFFMSIILDIEPALDQEIMKRYQEKFNKVPMDVKIALEELSSAGHFPENEQVFKLKTMKSILERGEKINLEVFLEVTEQLRKII